MFIDCREQSDVYVCIFAYHLDKNSNQNQLEPKEYISVYYIYKVHGGGSHGHNLKIENGHVDNETLH